VDGDDAARRRGAQGGSGQEGALRRGEVGVHEHARSDPVSDARVSRGVGDLMPRSTRTALKTLPIVAASLLSVTACHRSGAARMTDEGGAPRDMNVMQASNWRSLFDGKTLDSWRAYKTQDAPRGWTVVDGTISKQRGAQDLVTKDQFGDFELELEWKIGV